ncbi:uncharacterized protein FA14DRAFT_40575 [Meira miltonrushii]|uniref:Tudor domain-containing protein n=1 Tax=Meira miltonrushii TaxID=1280837 RepID=A0A316VDH0_9BASI|nr:uncharacterized protein FA14DRAFT_40575 [Meira miltonrushii]PWN35364.1 hypothetical protein FA14DRAFT_40575 [Meira miltonrushii]
MDAEELRTYEQQLVQVRTALEADPKNEELRLLEEELQKIIDLNKDIANTQNAASSSSHSGAGPSVSKPQSNNIEPKHKFAAGDECQAKYEGDGRFYDARIVSVAGSQHNPMYTILFKGYNETAIVTSESLKPSRHAGHHKIASNDQAQSSSSQALGSRQAKLTPEEEAERERKKKRSEKKNERFANRTAEAQAVQNSWQKFAKKAEKKGHMKKEKSMFKTPDDPLAKVGVIGAGRGMTQYGDRKKHMYDGDGK